MPHTLSLNSTLLASMENLSLLARTVVEGFFDGLHRSPFLGYSTEFSAYRAYTQGDNLRHIDWKVWGRTDEFYVKQFEDDTNLRCQIFLDTSGSMDFGSEETNKFNYGRILAAVIAQIMVRQHDGPGLILFGDDAKQAIPAQAQRHQAEEIFNLLTHAQARGRTSVGQDLFQIIETFSRRGLAVVISDFFTAGDTAHQLLRQLSTQRQEILVFHILAPEEVELPYDGHCIFEDSESGEEIPVQAEDFRREYQSRFNRFCDELKAECVKLEVEYQRLVTDEPLDKALIAYLDRRAAL